MFTKFQYNGTPQMYFMPKKIPKNIDTYSKQVGLFRIVETVAGLTQPEQRECCDFWFRNSEACNEKTRIQWPSSKQQKLRSRRRSRMLNGKGGWRQQGDTVKTVRNSVANITSGILHSKPTSKVLAVTVESPALVDYASSDEGSWIQCDSNCESGIVTLALSLPTTTYAAQAQSRIPDPPFRRVVGGFPQMAQTGSGHSRMCAVQRRPGRARCHSDLLAPEKWAAPSSRPPQTKNPILAASEREEAWLLAVFES
ncbi:hypothetical protein B0H17DRAFT_1153081 [Mycena rosella]|uniref:Uncharacterized protein n=1 Tax=Mycena rosella TaxID=1033263 RepID=A0AAD7FBB6_MYCRO|nr:hypothetical protein B0H17DRAFT_1153081 [Mycena rosella]